ncbi:pH-response regulator protein palA/rim20 [Pseudogymnoascus australis]
MASNILFLPFRKSHSLVLSDAIRQYISGKYDQHPDMFKQDLEVIDSLRREAINVREPHVSGLKKIAAYAAQLVWMGGKFPIDIGADFTWFPALGYNTKRPISQDNLKFELCNILFNLAALYSQLAVSVNFSSPDGLKSAANYFCLAAGVISHIKDKVVPELRTAPVEDMDIVTLESLQELLLAQGQECFWQKAVMDGYKDSSIAKLAARVSDLYSTAGDWAVQSEAISSEWIHHMAAKHHHFAAAAQYRQACDCLEKRKYGEEVARLRDSMICVNDALKESRYVNKTVLSDLNGLKNKVSEDLKRAEKDNDLIYLNPVPPKSELKTLERAGMVVARVPPDVASPLDHLGDNALFGAPLFAKLVPFAVHLAASIYEERRDRLVNTQLTAPLSALTSSIHSTLSALSLPGSLQALEKPLGIPPALLAHAEELRQSDALARLDRSFADTAKLKATDTATFASGRDALLAEEAEDAALRARFGTLRWTRPPSREAAPKLHNQIAEIESYLASAAASDNLVRDTYRTLAPLLRILAGPERALADFVPASRRAVIPPKLEAEASALRTCLNDIARLESRRRRRIEALREAARGDDVRPALLAEAARLERERPDVTIVTAHFEAFFDARLGSRYDSEIAAVAADAEEQAALLRAVERANADFVRARRGEGGGEREKALQQLEGAWVGYKDVVAKLEMGRTFYNDLSRIVGRFREEAREFGYRRRAEAAGLESDLSLPPLSSLSLQNQAQQQQQQPAQQAHSSHSSRSQREEPMPAPIATRNPAPPPQPQQQQQQPPLQPGPVAGMWNPEMGIRFGGSPAPAGDGKKQQPQAGVWDPSAGLRFG